MRRESGAVFAKQANIANGPQQVNNGLVVKRGERTGPRARKRTRNRIVASRISVVVLRSSRVTISLVYGPQAQQAWRD